MDKLHSTARVITKALLVAGMAFGATAGILALQAAPPQGAPTKQDQVAALQKSLKESAAKIRNYEWVETTTLSMKGEEKSKTQKRCYYGADGKVQKTPIGSPAPAPAASGGGRGGRLKGKVVENKKEDIQEYMKKAAALVQQYVPPNPDVIQRAKVNNRIKVTQPAPGKVHVDIADYYQPGDHLVVDLDAAAGRLLGMNVASYLDKPEDTVTLAVQMAALSDGASYAARSTLDVKAKNIVVVIENSGYKPMAK